MHWKLQTVQEWISGYPDTSWGSDLIKSWISAILRTFWLAKQSQHRFKRNFCSLYSIFQANVQFTHISFKSYFKLLCQVILHPRTYISCYINLLPTINASLQTATKDIISLNLYSISYCSQSCRMAYVPSINS